MKKNLLFLLLFLLGTSLASFAQKTIELSTESLDVVLQRAKKEHKNVLFMGWASWCSHCANMKANVLTDPAVAAFYNAHYICAGQDMEKEPGLQLQQYFHVRNFPTFIFLDTGGRTLYRIAGEFDSKGFVEQGQNALDPEKQLPYLRSRFEANVSNAAYCLDYIMALRMGYMNTEKAAKKYFAAIPPDSLLTAMSWRIFANGISDLSSPEFRFALAHQKEYAAVASPERVKRKILAATFEKLNNLAAARDTANYFAQRAVVADTKIYSVDSLLFYLDIDLYEKTGNWKAYEKATLQYVDLYAAANAIQLKNIAENYLLHVSDASGLKKATTWAQQSMAMWENYLTGIVAAKLYRKLNDTNDALKMAGLAKTIAAKTGADAAEADKLLAELKQ